GGGLMASVYGGSRLTIVDTVFADNRAALDAATGVPRGGSAMIFVSDTATALIHRSTFTGGRVTGGIQRRGAGLALQTEDTASARVEDPTFSGNHGVAGETAGAGLALSTVGSSTIDARRLSLTENRWGGADLSSQLHLRPWGTSMIRLSDSLVARGGTGIDGESSEGSMRVVNVTVTDHIDRGLD